MQQAIHTKVASNLWTAKAVKINYANLNVNDLVKKPPIYVESSVFASLARPRWHLASDLGDTIMLHFPQADALIAMSPSAITHTTLAAHYLHLPMGYINSISKTNDRNIIGGDFANKKVVIIADFLLMGTLAAKTVEIFKKTNIEIIGIVALFSYQLDILINNLKNIKYYALTNLEDLLEVGIKDKYISSQKAEEIQKYFKKYQI